MHTKKQHNILLTMKNNFIYFIVYHFLNLFLNFCLMTCRFKVTGKDIFKGAQQNNNPILICCWHSRFLLVAYYFKTINLNVWAVSSTHKDSQMMAKILQRWGFQLIKGSSTRGWMSVLKTMIKLFKNKKNIIAMTNDGPKGPPLIAKEGSVKVAMKSNAQIIAITGEAEKFWSLPSWDKTIIPKPFSTIHIQYAQQFQYNNQSTSKHISKYMNDNYFDLQNKVVS